MNKAKIKIYHSYGDTGYSNFIRNREIVDNIKDADLVFFEGGADCDPATYGEPMNKRTYCNDSHNRADIDTYEEAAALGKRMYGTCKGLQHLNIMAGGKLIQHMSHPGRHSVYLKGDKKGFMVNSLHHQMIYPYGLPADHYEILSYAKHLSPYHLGGKDEELEAKDGMEIEAAFFPKIKALGVQYHPEMMWGARQMNKEAFEWLFTQFQEKLDLDIASPLMEVEKYDRNDWY